MSALDVLSRGFVAAHPEDAARVLDRQPSREVTTFLSTLAPAEGAPVLERLAGDVAASTLVRMDPGVAGRFLGTMDPGRVAELLARLEDEARLGMLELLDPGLRREVEELMAYPPDTAGRLMDPRVTTFRPEATVEDALRRIREQRERRVDAVFLVDAEGHLLGYVSLADLAREASTDRLDQHRQNVPLAVQAMDPREEVIDQLGKSVVPALPVVDLDGRLLGVIRTEALVRAAEEEATVDMQTMVGVSRDERALSSVGFAVRKRLPWLHINLVTAFLAASVVGLFEDTIARYTALAVLLPVVAGQSGNTGAQALAVAIRGLALREVRVRHWLVIVWKETRVGFLNGVAVALTTSAGVYVWSGSSGLALVIGLSMVISMVAAGLSGAGIPMILTALRQDPAQSSSIFLTTVTDVVGFFSFLGIATVLSAML